MSPDKLLPDFHYRDGKIQTPERTWEFTAGDLADHRGIGTKLDREVWLDWSDVLAKPEEARMHMYPGQSKDVSLAVKRHRMETWQAAIRVYDTMMVDVDAPLDADFVVDLLKRQRLPRPKTVVLPTSNPSLIKLLDSLGIGREGTHVAEWAHLVELAKEGALLQPKRYLRKSQS